MRTVATPLVSVVMPVFNAEPYLAQAVDSILAQTLGDFELLIFDDGSTDGSRDMLRAYADRDDRVRLFFEEHAGYCVWLNKGLELAAAPFLARMDADDVSMPRRFQQQVAYMNAHPDCVALGCEVEFMDPDGDLIGLGERWRPLTHDQIDAAHLSGRGCMLLHPTVMFGTDALRAVGGYRTQFEPAEDHEVMLRLAERGRLANLPDPLFRYRLHPNMISHVQRQTQVRLHVTALEETYRRRGLDMPADFRMKMPERLSLTRMRLLWTRLALEAGQHRTAVKHGWPAARRRPFSADVWRQLAEALATLEGNGTLSQVPYPLLRRPGVRRAVRLWARTLATLVAARRSLRRGALKTPVLWRLLR
jgi:glycosyltransferase involved in cell wall biosynthesis